jgi:hypothetical protein
VFDEVDEVEEFEDVSSGDVSYRRFGLEVGSKE